MSNQVKIEISWRKLGQVGLGAQGKLVFPRAPSLCGLYRFELVSVKGQQDYIGETGALKRRFQNYRNPDPSQGTNIRLNSLIRKVISSNGVVGVSIVLDGDPIKLDGEATFAHLNCKNDRIRLENAALQAADRAGVLTVNANKERSRVPALFNMVGVTL